MTPQIMFLNITEKYREFIQIDKKLYKQVWTKNKTDVMLMLLKSRIQSNNRIFSMKIRSVLLLISFVYVFAVSAAEPERDMKITVFGSSTVWGNGLLGERSMAGVIDNYLRDSWSTSIYPDQMKFSAKPVTVKNRKFFRGSAAKIYGKGSSVEFDMTGKKLVIWQAIARTSDYGEMTVYADGVKIGTFDNRNNTIGCAEKSFKANGKQNLFSLDRAFTYGHQVFADGREQKFKAYDLPYVKGSVEKMFPGYDGVIVRARPGERVNHFAYFFKAPQKEVKIKYNYGETIAYTACTVGGLANDENTLESTFGVGRVPYDMANPTKMSTGLDFRYSNPRACKVFEFSNAATRKIKIEITGGKNPYFMINFATNFNHSIMNAGIGGFTASMFLNDKSRRRVSDALTTMVPDAAFIILGGNDDWAEKERLVCRKESGLTEQQVKKLHSMFYRSITQEKDGSYTAVRNAGTIDGITPVSLVSRHLVGAKVSPGNYLRIGNYYGDNQSTVVRRVLTFDGKNGKVTWKEPLDAGKIVGISQISDLKGADFTVRTLSFYKENISGMIKVLRKANPQMRIVLLNTYTPNYFCREIWAYAEALEDVAAQYENVVAADSSPAVYEWIKTQFDNTRRKFTIKANGTAVYQIPKIGHWQGFQVWVNGKDVYGKDCRVESGRYYAPQKLSDGKWKIGRTVHYMGENLKLVFTSNIPPAGTKITVKLADKVWSNDYAHPTPEGCVIVGDTAYKALCRLMNIKP